MNLQPSGFSPETNAVLSRITGGLAALFGNQLTGVYLYGSLLWGDFDPALSDLDLAAVLEAPVNREQLEVLRAFHTALVREFPAWEDRIEVQYVSRESLACFRERETQMANISPGEPLHLIPCNRDWLTNWYFIRAYGRALCGPEPGDVLPDISHNEFLGAVYAHAQDWRTYVENTRSSQGYQGYAILTLCRALTTLTTGKQVSKQKAADWVSAHIPEYAPLIARALTWRRTRDNAPADETFVETRRFVLDMAERIEKTFGNTCAGGTR